VVSVTPRPPYPQGKRPLYPLDRRLGGPQSQSGCGGEEKNYWPAGAIYIGSIIGSLGGVYIRTKSKRFIGGCVYTVLLASWEAWSV